MQETQTGGKFPNGMVRTGKYRVVRIGQRLVFSYVWVNKTNNKRKKKKKEKYTLNILKSEMHPEPLISVKCLQE